MAEVDHSFHSRDLERVVQAVRAKYPDWGIGKCKQWAEGIMNEGKAKYYDSAVRLGCASPATNFETIASAK